MLLLNLLIIIVSVKKCDAQEQVLIAILYLIMTFQNYDNIITIILILTAKKEHLYHMIKYLEYVY